MPECRSTVLPIHEVLEVFQRLLSERFGKGVTTTEDSIRFTFYAALLEGGAAPEDIVLEYPHPKIQRAFVDTWLEAVYEQPFAIEFKYNRSLSNGRNRPRTEQAGAIYGDLRRLAEAWGHNHARCLFVYVTDEEMAKYFYNPGNQCSELFSLKTNETWGIGTDFFNEKPKSFLKASKSPFRAEIEALLSVELPSDHSLRVYELRDSEVMVG